MEDTSKQEILEAIGSIGRRQDEMARSQDEILSAIGVFAEQVDQRFEKIDQRFNKIEATMVTKSYLDDKLADLKGDMVALVRREDEKVDCLVGTMEKKKMLTASEARLVAAKGPFSR